MAGLNWKKPHTIHGAGPGSDIVVQNGVLYSRDGQMLPQTIKGLETGGFQVSLELRQHLVSEAAKRREEDVTKRVRELIRKKEEELKAKIGETETPLFDEDGEYINLDLEGLEELVEEMTEAPHKPSGKVRQPSAPPAKTKKAK